MGSMSKDCECQEATAEEIKAFARSAAACLQGGKIFIPRMFAARLRALSAWDDSTMLEIKLLPLGEMVKAERMGCVKGISECAN